MLNYSYFDIAESNYSFEKWLHSDAEEFDFEAHRKNVIKVAIQQELTEKQRFCFCKYFIEGWSVYAIAAELCVNVSTVSRTLTSARNRIARAIRYSSPNLLNSSQRISNRRK